MSKQQSRQRGRGKERLRTAFDDIFQPILQQPEFFMDHFHNPLNIDPLERRYLSFQPLVILAQALFTGLLALLIVTLIGDIVVRIKVYRLMGTWPDWGTAAYFYTGFVLATLLTYFAARRATSATHNALRFLTLALAIILTAELYYGAIRFLPAYRLNKTFALEWVPYAVIAGYLLVCVGRACWLAFNTDREMGRVLSFSPDTKAFSWVALRRAVGLPVVADYLSARHVQVTVAILLSTLALAWLPFTALSGTFGMPFAVDSINFVCPAIVEAIKTDPTVFDDKTLSQLGWSRQPENAGDCVNAILPTEAAFGTATWWGKWAFVLATMAGPIILGAWAWRFARTRIRFSIDELTKSDPRAPVLFLRPFADDQVLVKKENRTLLLAALETGRNANTLDEVMLDEATAMGPVVALGNPRDKFPPYGAARNYFLDKDWQQAVVDLCRSSAAIVIVMDAAENVIWEIRHIFENNLQDKTLFLFHPTLTGKQADQADRHAVETSIKEMIGGEVETEKFSHEDLLGFFISGDGKLILLKSSTQSRAAYLLSIRAFFRRSANGVAPTVTEPESSPSNRQSL